MTSAIQDLISTAQTLILDANEKVRSSQYYIDALKLKGITPTNYAFAGINYGWANAIGYIGQQMKRQHIFDLLLNQYEYNPKKNKELWLAQNIAMAKFGFGECGEINAYILPKASEYGYILYVNAVEKSKRSPRKSHALCIFNSTLEDHLKSCKLAKSGITISSFWKELPSNSVIVDVFFKVVCQAHDVVKHDVVKTGSQLMQYIKLMDLEYIEEDYVADLTYNDKRAKSIEEKANKIYTSLHEELVSGLTKGKQIYNQWSTLLNLIGTNACSNLNAIFPATSWKPDIKSGLKAICAGRDSKITVPLKVFSICPKAVADKVSETLKSKTIKHINEKVKNDSTYCIVIDNPDLDKIGSLIANPHEKTDEKN